MTIETTTGEHGQLLAEHQAAQRWGELCVHLRVQGLKPAKLPEHIKTWEDACKHALMDKEIAAMRKTSARANPWGNGMD